VQQRYKPILRPIGAKEQKLFPITGESKKRWLGELGLDGILYFSL